MINRIAYMMSGTSDKYLEIRLTALCAMSRLEPYAHFYAKDVGADGGLMNLLKSFDLVQEIPGEEKDEFVCLDDVNEIYKKVKVKCWKMIISPEGLRHLLREYAQERANIYAKLIISLP